MSMKVQLLVIIGLMTAATLAPGVRAEQAERILDETGIQGGLAVVLGCSDAQTLAGLHAGGAFTVVGLDTDPARLAEARESLSTKGTYGPVTAIGWDGKTLPFTDNLVNLLVIVREGSGPAAEEQMRALCPEGMVLELKGGAWEKTVKPRPAEIDDWPQYFYSATGNAASHDTVVGPPRSLQWWAGPFSERSHNWVNSTASMVSAGGRFFYIRDDGPISVMGQGNNNMNWAMQKNINKKNIPENWSLIARDAFNGVLLWRRKLDGFGQFQFEAVGIQPTSWNCWSAPLSLNRRTAASERRVFTTLAYRGGLSALNALTGETEWEYAPDGHVDEVVLDKDEGRLYLRVRSQIPRKHDYPFSWWNKDESWMRTYGPVEFEQYVLEQKPEKVVCLDAEDGRLIWSYDAPHVAVETLCAGYGKVCFLDLQELICLDAETGRKVWSKDFTLTKATRAKMVDGKEERGRWSFSRSGRVGQLLLWQNRAYLFGLMAEERGSHCYSLEDGEAIWSQTHVGPSGGFGHPTGIRIIDGIIWNDHPMGFDALTGARIGELAPRPYGGTHNRCHRGMATNRYILGIAFGIEFYDIAAKEMVSDDRWLRSACALGYLPANGMLYHAPDPCACWLGARIRGFHAFAPKEPELDYGQVDGQERLATGPAYAGGARATAGSSDDWPTYRHDVLRSGQASTAVPADLGVRWRADLGSPYDRGGHNVVCGLSPPVVAGNRVFVSRKDANEIVCLDERTGDVLWRFQTPCFVDSPPTIADGLVLFGCADGYVRCLRASDGALAWRFRAAPADMMVLFDGRPGSKWPVSGSVLVQNGHLYCAAGHSSFLDGGIHFYKLDAVTGRMLAHARTEGPRYGIYEQNPFREVKKNQWGRLERTRNGYYTDYVDIEGARADILVSDGVDVRMGQTRITPDLKISSILREQVAGTAPEGRRWLRPMHLFLDDTYFHRVGWHYSDQYYGGGNAAGAANAGKILVFDDQHSYGAQWEWEPGGRYPNHIIGQGTRLTCDLLSTENERRGFGASRQDDPVWTHVQPLIIRAMVLARATGSPGKALFVAAPLERKDTDPDPLAPHLGRSAGQVGVFSATDGKLLGQTDLPAQPVFDGMAAADGRLFLSLTNGRLVCLGSE